MARVSKSHDDKHHVTWLFTESQSLAGEWEGVTFLSENSEGFLVPVPRIDRYDALAPDVTIWRNRGHQINAALSSSRDNVRLYSGLREAWGDEAR